MNKLDKIEDILLNRAISSFPISISTAKVLESIFDPIIDPYDIENVPSKIDIYNYKCHYFNVYTLIRNIVEALNTSGRDIVLMEEVNDILYRVLQREIREISMLYESIKCKPIIYFPIYDEYDKLPSLKEFKPKTKTYVKNTKIENVVSYIFKNRLLKDIEVIYLRDNKLLNTSNSLITTHLPIDLIHIAPSCHLLESYTGKLKDHYEFNTRYSKLKGFNNDVLPFNKTILYLLGDNNGIIKGVDVGTKRELLRIAYEKKWYVFTTETQVKSDIKHIIKRLHTEDSYWNRFI